MDKGKQSYELRNKLAKMINDEGVDEAVVITALLATLASVYVVKIRRDPRGRDEIIETAMRQFVLLRDMIESNDIH